MLRNRKTSYITIFLFMIFISSAGVTGAYYAISKLATEEIKAPSEPVTHFYIRNETEIIAENPAVYRIMIENREGEKIDYEVKVLLDGKEIYNKKTILQNNDISNETISVIPNMKGEYQKLEFVLFKGIEPLRTYVFQIIPSNESGQFPPTNTLSLQNSKIKENKVKNINVETNETQKKDYTVEKNGDSYIYIFNSGERLELAVRNGNVSEGDAVYSTVSDGNLIMFVRELHEKIIPTSLMYLYPIILEINDNKLTINESLKLKDGYNVTLKDIDSQNINSETLKIDILKNNKVVREIISRGNSPIEYWHQIDDYKKDKVIRIIPTSISKTDMMFDITQYGSKKKVLIGDTYEEFKIQNITQDSIIMKNTRPLILEPGKELSLIKGKIKIIV